VNLLILPFSTAAITSTTCVTAPIAIHSCPSIYLLTDLRYCAVVSIKSLPLLLLLLLLYPQRDPLN